MPLQVAFEDAGEDIHLASICARWRRAMTGVAVVGAAETTELGKIPHMSQIQLHADAALNAMADAGLTAKDIDGIATCRQPSNGSRPTI